MTEASPPPWQFDAADAAARGLAVRPRRLLVLHNPVAGWRRIERFRETVAQLERHGCPVAVHATTGPGDAEAIAAGAEAADVLVVAGGDGTINEALNGLSRRPSGMLPLGVIPLGTANVLAEELGVPTDPADVARAIAHGRIVTAHLGQAHFDGASRNFTLMAGAGIDAQAVARVRTPVKRRFGKGAYVLAGLEAAAAYRYPTLRVQADGTWYDCAQVVVCKGHFYAGRYVLAPDVRPWLPELHVVLFERFGSVNAARYAFGMQFDRLAKMPDVRVVKATTVTIDGPTGDPIQGDGDLLGALPVKIDLLPEAARFVIGDPP
ncbi:diacylglycerol/lipid kinase family protein [Rhodovibrio salinarum]|nr:diacylglycerol kinase family protein [Rhodovibrio salinarum]